MEKILQLSILRRDWLSNVVAALLWCYYLFNSGKGYLEHGQSIFLLFLFRNSLIVILFLFRREAKNISLNPRHWIIAFSTTVFAFAFKMNETVPLLAPFISNTLFVIGATLACYAVFNLGKSWGIVPANRGIVTDELYKFIRHPIYASYIVMDIAMVLSAFSWFNVLLFVSLLILFNLRASYEENFLKNDPVYQKYCEKVRYRFIPGIL